MKRLTSGMHRSRKLRGTVMPGVGLLMLLRLMKFLLFVLISSVAFSTATVAQCKLHLRIGAKVPVKCLPDGETRYVATHPSQFRPFIERIVAGVNYTIAFDEENQHIKYIHTIDRAFRTANRLRFGSQIKITRKQITGGYGWYTFAGRTPDGWDIIVADIASLNDWKEGEKRSVTIGGFKKGDN